jgi:hypothetical protein
MNHSMKLLLLLAAGIFFSSCSKLKNSDPYYKISDQFKQYCQFQKQSTWTYQNDSTKNLHKISVSDISSYIGFHSPNNVAGAYSFDAVDMIYDTANDLNIAKGTISAGNPSTGSGKMHDLYWLFYKNGNYLLAFAPGFPMSVGQRLGNNPGFYTNLQKLSNFKLNGKDYTDVYHTEIKKTEGTPDTVYYQFYFAPHYGLIKWTRRVNSHITSYSLVQSNLIQK